MPQLRWTRGVFVFNPSSLLCFCLSSTFSLTLLVSLFFLISLLSLDLGAWIHESWVAAARCRTCLFVRDAFQWAKKGAADSVALGNTALVGYGDFSHWTHLSLCPHKCIQVPWEMSMATLALIKFSFLQWAHYGMFQVQWPVIAPTNRTFPSSQGHAVSK